MREEQEHAAMGSESLKTVIILTTGGTIAGTGESGKANNYTIGGLDADSLICAVPGIEKLANLKTVPICNIGSCDLDTGLWLTLTRTINQYAKDPEVAGFVVTHGTDTLDETAYWLNLTVKTEKPVVLTGAMRPATATSPDGPMNLYEAVGLAASQTAAGRGVMVVFGDGIYGGRDVVKINTVEPTGFGGRDMGQIGYMMNAVPLFYTATVKKHTIETEFQVDGLDTLPRVDLAFFCIDADVRILDYMTERAAGLVIAGAGGGSMSDPWVKKMASLEDKGYPVVRTSRVSNGPLHYSARYDSYSNVIRGNNLAPQKAKILLQLALTVTNDVCKIAKIFNTY